MHRSHCALGALLLTLLASIGAHASGNTYYQITDITGPTGNNSFRPTRIFDNGTLFGHEISNPSAPVVWAPGVGWQALPAELMQPGLDVADMNEAGWFTGMEDYSPFGVTPAFRWSPQHGMETLSMTNDSGSIARGLSINAQGDVALSYGNILAGTGQTAVWQANGAVQPVPSLPGSIGWVSQNGVINDAGAVVSTTVVPLQDGPTPMAAYYWSAQTGSIDLGNLGGNSVSSVVPRGMNGRGDVVGTQHNVNQLNQEILQAFLWDPANGMEGLGALVPDTFSEAKGVNDDGIVVGESGFPGGPVHDNVVLNHAFIWTAESGMQDLNALTDFGDFAGMEITSADAINGQGQIAAEVYYDGLMRAVVLTPAPEPASVALLACGLVALTGVARRKRETHA